MKAKKPALLNITHDDLVQIQVVVKNIPNIPVDNQGQIWLLDQGYIPTVYENLEKDIWDVVCNPKRRISLATVYDGRSTFDSVSPNELVIEVLCPDNRIRSSRTWIDSAITRYIKKTVSDTEKKIAAKTKQV